MVVSTNNTALESTQRRLRLLLLLDAAEGAGLTPLGIINLHAFAYLSNVLSPVWDIRALDGKVFKKKGGPFYPALQHDLDRLVGQGLAIVSGLGYQPDENGRWRIEGMYRVNHSFADRIVAQYRSYEDENHIATFIDELAYALAALHESDVEAATNEDASYSDSLVTVGNVIDFAEWQNKNFSANAARYFKGLLPSGATATPGELLHLYVGHLYQRLHGQRG